MEKPKFNKFISYKRPKNSKMALIIGLRFKDGVVLIADRKSNLYKYQVIILYHGYRRRWRFRESAIELIQINKGKRGRPFRYSDAEILNASAFRFLMKMGLRQTTVLCSLPAHQEINPAPREDRVWSTACRREIC